MQQRADCESRKWKNGCFNESWVGGGKGGARRYSEALPGRGLKGDIIRRCVATTGDVSIKDVIRFSGEPEEGVKALKEGCRIITDVHMVKGLG